MKRKQQQQTTSKKSPSKSSWNVKSVKDEKAKKPETRHLAHDVFEQDQMQERGKLDTVDTYEYSDQQIDSEDDEELEDDEAFNDSDEEKYGTFFETSKPLEDEEEEEFSSEDGEDYMDISTMLDKDSRQDSNANVAIRSFLPNQSDSDEFDDEVMDLQDSDQEEESKDLSNFVAALDGKRKRKRIQEQNHAAQQSEFGLGPNSMRKKLALTDLMSAVESEAGFAGLKKQISNIKENDKVVTAPLPKRIQDKFDRKAAHEATSKDISKWVPLVKKNREAESLVFPMNVDPLETVTAGALVSKFEPITDLEKEIDSMLEASGLTEKQQKETEELELAKLKKRQKELSQMRSLMFYQEQKQKKIAKIKSKTYRKIHKKEAEKNQLNMDEMKDLDPEYVRAEMEKLETERARERMTLKHRNTGKWAKKLLGRKDLDEESRQALQLQLRKHEDLKRRIQGLASDESEESSQGESDEDAIESAKAAIDQMEKEMNESEDDEPLTGVLGMKFMQRSLKSQKEQARLDIAKAKRELDRGLVASDEESDSESDEEVNGRRVFTKTNPTVSSGALEELDEEEYAMEASGTSVVVNEITQLQKPIFAIPSFDIGEKKTEYFAASINQSSVQMEEPIVEHVIIEKPTLLQPIESSIEETVDDSTENPWLQGLEDSQGVRRKAVSKRVNQADEATKKLKKDSSKAKDHAPLYETKEILLTSVEAAPKVPEPIEKPKRLMADSSDDSDLEDNEMVNQLDIKNLSGLDILKMAFENDNLITEFEAEKLETAQKDQAKEEDLTLPGWGSWSGAGLAPKEHVVVKVIPGVDQDKRKDAKLKHVIINEKRMKQTSKYMVPQLPHGFDTREQYERSLRMPLGKEWNTSRVHSKMIVPKVQKRVGAVIKPLRLPNTKKM